MKRIAQALFLAAALAGCATQGQMGRQEYLPEHGGPGYGPEGPASSTNVVPGGPGPAASGTSGQAGTIRGSADEMGMCELHRRIMSARTPAERQALMEQYMPGMSADMRMQHMQMMRDRCQ